jgi:hypothetical protein
VPPSGSRPLGFFEVPKPIAEMTDEERRAFAAYVAASIQAELAKKS